MLLRITLAILWIIVNKFNLRMCSTYLLIQEMHIKTFLRFHLTLFRMIIIKKP